MEKGCLFTYACTRGVHLEIVLDLTINSFLLAFRRFASHYIVTRPGGRGGNKEASLLFINEGFTISKTEV